MQTSGLVLDLYDDTEGEVLRTLFPTMGSLPERVKTAAALDFSERERLPDDVFALVLVDGGQKLRKYACHDAGNTELSSAYLLKTGHRMAPEAERLAAHNICEAYGWYGMEPSAELQKLALGVGTAISALTAIPVIKGTHQQVKENLGAVKQLEGPGHIVTPDQLRQAKTGELVGSDVMPLSAPSSDLKPKAVIKKTAAHHLVEGHHPKHLVSGHGGEHDETLHNGDGVTGKQPVRLPQHREVHFVVTEEQTTSPVTEKKAETYALGDKFPIDNLLQLKAAAAYFDEYGERFAPADRRDFCAALVKKAAPLRLPLSKTVRKYGSPSYAPLTEMKVAQDLRRNYFESATTERKVLDALFEKRASLSADLFCAALGEFDQATGLDFYYDRGVPDPYYSTFGMQKAAEEFSEVIGNEMMTEEDLRRLARIGAFTIKNLFNNDFLTKFQKDPIGVFKSLPRDQRLLVMRMANDTSPGQVRA